MTVSLTETAPCDKPDAVVLSGVAGDVQNEVIRLALVVVEEEVLDGLSSMS